MNTFNKPPHPTARGGNMAPDLSKQVYALFSQFGDILAREASEAEVPRAVVRAQLPCNILGVLDASNLWVITDKQLGLQSIILLDQRKDCLSAEGVYHAARWDRGYDDPVVLQFPAAALGQDPQTREATLTAIAKAHVQAEIQRVHREMNVIQISPIFGPVSYVLNPHLAFVLMPFRDELTRIFDTFVKPTVELPDFGLVCKRADDIKSNRVIIQDIWKSICEARIVLADLTGLNANVMYELGIAHAVGKDTILIYQRGDEIEFPFDLAHIRRIEYTDNAVGGHNLEEDLKQTLTSVLATAPHS